jgi:hypothetical protein
MKSLADFLPIQSAIDPRTGRYDARQLAKLLDWTSAEIAQYLERSPSMIATSPTAATLQDRLAALAALFAEIVKMYTLPDAEELDPDVRGLIPNWNGKAVDGTAGARAYLRTPMRVYDGKSAKARILEGRIDWVQGVVMAGPDAAF